MGAKYILIALLLCSSVYAVEPRGDSLITNAFMVTNLPSTGTANVTQAKCLRFLNEGVQVLSKVLPAFPKFDTVETEDGVTNYALNSDFNRVRWVKRMVGDTMSLGLDALEPAAAYEKRGGVAGARGDETSVADPRYYTIHGTYLSFYPNYAATFGDTAVFEVAYYAVGQPFDSLGDTTDLPEEYLPLLVDYVCARIKETQKDFQWATWFYSKLPDGIGKPKSGPEM